MARAQQRSTAAFQVAREPLGGDLAEGHQPFFGTFAQNAQHVVVQPHVEQRQAHQLADAQATGVHQLQHGAVAQAQGRLSVRCVQQGLDLEFAQGLGHAQGLLGRLQFQRRVDLHRAFPQRPAEITLEHGQATVGRGGFGVYVLAGEKALHIGLGAAVQRTPIQPGGINRHIAPVRVE